MPLLLCRDMLVTRDQCVWNVQAYDMFRADKSKVNEHAIEPGRGGAGHRDVEEAAGLITAHFREAEYPQLRAGVLCVDVASRLRFCEGEKRIFGTNTPGVRTHAFKLKRRGQSVPCARLARVRLETAQEKPSAHMRRAAHKRSH
jgi:hypothetical protein